MRLLIDRLEEPYYIDVVLSEDDIERMKYGEMVEGYSTHRGQRFYIGARRQGFRYEKESSKEDEESDA